MPKPIISAFCFVSAASLHWDYGDVFLNSITFTSKAKILCSMKGKNSTTPMGYRQNCREINDEDHQERRTHQLSI